ASGAIKERLNGIIANRPALHGPIGAFARTMSPFRTAGGFRGAMGMLNRAIARESPELFEQAMGQLLTPGRAAYAAAKAYLSPAGGFGDWAVRMGYLGAGAFIGGSAWRMMSGTGSPVTYRGKFDIAGIPFI